MVDSRLFWVLFNTLWCCISYFNTLSLHLPHMQNGNPDNTTLVHWEHFMSKYKLSTVLARISSINSFWDFLLITDNDNQLYIHYPSCPQIIWVYPTHQHGRKPGNSFLFATMELARKWCSFWHQSVEGITYKWLIYVHILTLCLCLGSILHSYSVPQWNKHDAHQVHALSDLD